MVDDAVDLIGSIAPPALVVRETRDFGAWRGGLTDAEARTVASARAPRQQEFEVGRTLARSALAELCGDLADAELLRTASGAVLWPDGVVGSISHCHDHAVAAVGWAERWRCIGVDVETVGRVSARILRRIAAPSELTEGLADDHEWSTGLFTAKEAVFKAWHSAFDMPLRFSDMTIGLPAKLGQFEARVEPQPTNAPQQRLQGRTAVAGAAAGTIVAVPARGTDAT